ncbi:SDR family NAD(P)-dependent oxidoreductase [Candidatus Palauibacter sp.]|uniref:SDR family NAD(P)-dependent oxidoreductase n=1 Tax=Candidatus Palauibacter sp. TaxID=3101350 RepID=UPI003B02DE4E
MRSGRADSLTARYGEWAVVAGASEGLGAAFAEQLAERGMHLVLIARRGSLLMEVAAELRGRHGVEVRCLGLDLADPSFAGVLADATAGLDLGVLIYNAAYVQAGPFLDAEEEALERVVDVNVRGPILFLRALLAPMCDRGRGAVVLMSSLSGLQGAPHVSAYAASKAFNAILAEGLWYELRAHGIDVAACLGGAMRTPGYIRSFNRDVPGMLAPEEAVRRTLDALDRGPRLVPGLVNRISAQLMGRLLSRRTAIRLIAGNTTKIT